MLSFAVSGIEISTLAIFLAHMHPCSLAELHEAFTNLNRVEVIIFFHPSEDILRFHPLSVVPDFLCCVTLSMVVGKLSAMGQPTRPTLGGHAKDCLRWRY